MSGGGVAGRGIDVHDHLHVHRHGPLHRVPPHGKVVATLTFVAAVVVTDRTRIATFAIHAALVVIALAVARVPLRRATLQLLLEVPVLLFALALPFVARGERIDVGPVALSTDGLWGAWNILAKATLGVAAVMVLTATTPVGDLLGGLRRLRVPLVFIGIASFMVRYLDILQSDLHRMNVARVARGDRPRWIWQARAVAATAGSLFVRTYERGERVHLAMRARGFVGAFPDVDTHVEATTGQRLALATPCALAWLAVAQPSLAAAFP